MEAEGVAVKRPAVPHEVVHDARAPEVIRLCLFALALVAAINLIAVPFLELSPVNQSYHVVQLKWNTLLELEAGVDWLILGDSTCNQGVDPAVIRAELGGSAINLCTIGNLLAANDEWMLRKYIERHGSPRNVLVIHSSEIWTRELDLNSAWMKVPEGAQIIEMLDQYRPLSGLDRLQLSAYKWLPLYYYNETLRQVFRGAQILPTARPEYTPDGMLIVARANPEQVERNTSERLRLLQSYVPVISSGNQHALRRTAALAEEYGFDVYLFNGPVHDTLAAAPDFQRYFAQIQHGIAAEVGYSSRVHHDPTVVATFPRDQMVNSSHVIASAATTFTARLAERVRALRLAATESSLPAQPRPNQTTGAR